MAHRPSSAPEAQAADLAHDDAMTPEPADVEAAKALVAANPDLLPNGQHDLEKQRHSDESSSVAASFEKERSEESKEKDIPRDSTNTTSSSSSSIVKTPYDRSKLLALPPQKGPAWYRAFRWQFFTVYRKIYTVVFLLNLVWGLVGFSIGSFGDDDYASGTLASDSVATAVAVNVMVAIAIRNEHVINIIFSTSIAVPHSAPLWLRKMCAMIYSYGGLHSGCSTAASVWYAIYTGVAAREYVSGRQTSPVFVILASVLLGLLVSMIVLAMPNLRQRYHNWFECVHRFAGWTVLALFWAQLASSAALNGRRMHARPGVVLVTSPAFWFLLAATLLVVYPWARLRKREVVVEALSNHAVRLHFAHFRPALCSAIRISDRPLRENHAFATIPAHGGGQTDDAGFSVVVSSAGDWTRRMIARPPQKLWIRSGPNQGMAAVTKLFSPVVLMATGSGIGPCLGFFVGAPGHDVRVIWSTKNPLRTYGQGVIDAVRKADPRARIIDTDETGRPDLIALAYSVYKESGAEAVCIISNKKVVDMVVFGMETRGVPAYGPIWDS